MSQVQSDLNENAGSAIEETIQDLMDVPDIQALSQAAGSSTVQIAPPEETSASSSHAPTQDSPEVPAIIVDPPQSNAHNRQSLVPVAQQPKGEQSILHIQDVLW